MADAPKPAEKKDWFPIVILIILLAGAGGWSVKNTNVSDISGGIQTPNIVATTTTALLYTNTKYGFLFSYPQNLYPHERANGVILLPTQTFPDIASEIYALGRYVIVSKNPLIGPYERAVTKTQFVQNITTEDNMFEGKPTKVSWERINGIDMLRVEHRNASAPHTLNYYAFSGDFYYNIQMHPFEGVDMKSQEYVDFMTVVNSFRLTSPVVSNPTAPTPAGACYVGGCSAQICSDQQGIASTCEYREVYSCFKTAKCERQSTGVCGWTPTQELNSCIQRNGGMQ